MHDLSSFQRPFALRNMLSLALLGLYICFLFFNMLGYSYWGDSLDNMITTIQEAYRTGSLYLDDIGTWFITIFYAPVLLFNVISLIDSLLKISQNRLRAIGACILMGANILTIWGALMLTASPFCQAVPQEGSADMGCVVSVSPADRGLIIPTILVVYVLGGGCLIAVGILVALSQRAYRRWLRRTTDER